MNNARLKKVTMQMPDDVTDWLRQPAKHNVSSVTTETIRVLRDRMHQERRAERNSATREVN